MLCEAAFLIVGLESGPHCAVDLCVEGLQVARSGPEGGLGKIDGDVLEAAEAHALEVFEHVVVFDGRPEAAAGG